MTILVIDDHPNLMRVTELALRTLGCRTFTAATTAAANHLLGTEKIDGIFLDVNLGAESGLDYLSQLVAQAIKTPVIMFTAQARDEVASEALSRGALGLLVKPFTLVDLTQQMRQLEQYWRDDAEDLPKDL